MTYINERISDEDIKKYKIDEIWLKYHPEYQEIPSYAEIEWTVDRERSSFFLSMKAGREEFASQHTYAFMVNNELFKVIFERLPGSSESMSDRPFKISLGLVGIWPAQPANTTMNEVLSLLKAARTCFGYRGTREQVPDTVVEFKNF